MSMLTTHFSNLYMTPAIVKKLLGFKVNPQFESPDVSSISNTSLSNHNKLCEKAIRNLVKRLKKTPGSLDELEKAVSTKNPNTKCILISFNNKTTNLQSDNRVATTQSRKTLPHVVCCRIWRFPDLQNCNELKSNCQNGYNHNQSNAIKRNDDASLICINPYHYVRCTETGSSIQQQQQQSQLTVYVPKQQILNTNINNNNNNRKNLLDAKLNTITSLNNNNLIDINNHLQPMDITSNTTTITTTSTTTTTELNSKTSLNTNNNNNEIIPSPNDYMITTTTNTTTNNNNFIPLNNINNNNNNGITTTTTTTSSSSSSGSTSSFIIHSPQSSPPPPPLSFKNNSILNNNQCSPISTSPASNAMMSQQFSPFISEDDSSEINDISPSPIGACELIGIPMIEQPYWCSLSYYEMKQRVGEMFHVASNVHSVTIDGYTDPSSAQRFCLGVLSNVNRTTEIEMTRHYIGRGLMLNYENGQVFAECLSENPVFVQSPNCNQRYHWHLATVVKIPPGCSLKIFDESDFVQLANETVFQGFEAVYALTRICTIRISFVKGWGAEYRRQTILNTPCWIEVHLNNPLKLVDQILTKMGSPRTKCTSFS